MAAETVVQVLVSPFLGTLFDNLSSLIRNEFDLIWGVNGEMEKLSDTLSTIQDVLDDAEVKQITDKTIRNWLTNLKNLAYDAEDVLDEYVTTTWRPKTEIVETKRCNSVEVFTDSISSCFDYSRSISRRCTIAKRIKKLREKFDEIAIERFKFHLNLNLIARDVQSGVKQLRETTSFLVEPQIYGRDKDREDIVNLLLKNVRLEDDDSRQHVSICAILGMGGLGKTTLAQMVHNDERIVNHFEVRCWVCVSEDFELKTLLKAIIESSNGVTHDLENMESLQRRLQERLSGKRFLVVLDDIWNEDQAKWEKLKSSLRCGGRGSSIIVTTRLKTVASMTSTLAICRPELLSEEDCWSLFKNRAFDLGSEEKFPNLKAIGKEIVKKCGGLPLAAKALGGLLRFKREENGWLFVKNSEIWDLPQDTEDAILPALRLSYNHLPSHVRQCFAYCSIFPKDYIMRKEELVHMWMANGFIQPKGSMDVEDVGNEIFNDLLWRSFFQDFEKDEGGNVVGCKMHDLMHDLACSIMGDECSIMKVGKTDIVGRRSSSTRHLSLVFGYSLWPSSTILEFSSTKTPSHMRTLLRLHCWPIKQVPPLQLIFLNLKCLRILDLSRTDIRIVPDSIGNLKHLRYLNLSHTDITSLPNDTFCTLRNLQTLKLNGCHKLQMLPEDLWKINNLRHLDNRGCYALT